MDSWDKDDFFIIDSEELENVESGFYGYAITDVGVITADDIEINKMESLIDGTGAYILVIRRGDSIEIWQDYFGSFGLYLYRKDERFVISNCFWTLARYICNSESLSLNSEYASQYLITGYYSYTYDETLICEVRQLDRADRVDIDVNSRTLNIYPIKYNEKYICPSSNEGLDILDSWYEKWTRRIRTMYEQGCNLSFDLSGGFDSRLTFMLGLGANIDLNRLNIRTIEDDLHTHGEDYRIASIIAGNYGLVLNKTRGFFGFEDRLSKETTVEQSFNIKLGFHKQMYFPYAQEGTYMFTGGGGECIRYYTACDMQPDKMINEILGGANRYGSKEVARLREETESILRRSFGDIILKHNRNNNVGIDVPDCIKRETYGRYHYGKQLVESYLRGNYRVSPAMDPLIHKINRFDEKCADRNLLMSIIINRYGKELMKFEFDGGHCIADSTLWYADDICSKNPYRNIGLKKLGCYKGSVEQKRVESKSITDESIFEYVLELYRDHETREHFSRYYDEEVLQSVDNDINDRKFHPLTNVFPVLAIARAVYLCEGKRQNE